MIQSVARPEPAPEGGVQLVRDWMPSGTPLADIVLVHGLGEHSGRYQRTGSTLAEAGFRVRSFDLLGFGASSGDRGDTSRWSRYLDQVQGHVEELRTSGRPLILLGQSMGGLIALDYALAERPRPDLLVLLAPSLSGGKPWQRAVAPILGRIAPTLRLPIGIKGDMLARDEAVGEAYFADPLVVTKATTRLGAGIFATGRRVVEVLDRLTVPTLVVHGGADIVVPTAVSEALAGIHLVERRVLASLRHEVCNEPEGPEVVADIIEWLKARLATA